MGRPAHCRPPRKQRDWSASLQIALCARIVLIYVCMYETTIRQAHDGRLDERCAKSVHTRPVIRKRQSHPQVAVRAGPGNIPHATRSPYGARRTSDAGGGFARSGARIYGLLGIRLSSNWSIRGGGSRRSGMSPSRSWPKALGVEGLGMPSAN